VTHAVKTQFNCKALTEKTQFLPFQTTLNEVPIQRKGWLEL